MQVELSPEELDEIIVCMDVALYTGMGYGHVTGSEEVAMQEFRQRLHDKLNALSVKEG